MPPVDRLKPIRAASSESGYTLIEFVREFPDDATCLEHLWRTRYSPDGKTAHCPKCDRDRRFKKYVCATRRQSWTCTGCGHHVHPTAGTIFEKSSTSLHLWFYAKVATVECVVTGPNPNVTMKTTPAFHIALEDGRGFGDVLDDIRREVAEILEASEIVAALR